MIRLVVTLLLLLWTVPVEAQRSLVIERFDAAITVNRDGTIDVTETITPRFTGSWNGIFRTIPVVYRTPQGFNWTIRMDLIGVTDGSGQQLRVEANRERHYVKYKIWVPGAMNTTRTVVLKYRAKNALRFFDEHDELYWNVTGDEWEVPIEAATAVITLPEGVEGVRAKAFNGAYRSGSQDADVTIDGNTIRIAMPHALAFREGLTGVVGWNPLVARPSVTAKTMGFLINNWPLLLPIFAFFGMYTLWKRRGRDPEPLPVAVRYEPPEALTPAEAGTLIDNSADMRDITATLVHLAVQGHIRIEERKKDRFLGILEEEDYAFIRNRDVAARGLARHERRVLDSVFDKGQDEVELSELEHEFYSHLPQIKSDIFERLIEAGHYASRPDRVQGMWVGIGLALGFGIAFGGGALAARLLLTPIPFVVAGILIGLIVIGFGVVMPARTIKGARTREQILGFEEFLRRVESERYAHVIKTPEMFEGFLPYAMAFGVEKKWAKAFEGIYLEPPQWYVGSNFSSFNVHDFSYRMGSLSTKAASTMSSGPRSSGGSGFGGGGGGGGFSGGGGGGGGGGGF